MRMAAAFLKERKREIWLCVILIGTFAGVSYLYSVRMDAVEYALLLSGVFILLSGVPDYFKYVRKHRELLEAEKGLESGMGGMPGQETLIEEDYQRIAKGLYEAKIEAESAGRIARQEMMDYYGMWVHQIKTPIAAMHVLLQAQEGCQLETDGMHQYAKEMKMELFKIEQYVEMVLTYLRMEEMSSDLSFEIYSLDSIIRQAVRKYSQMFILKKIRLEYAPVQMKVLTDEKWLCFVLEQILSNALKYTKGASSDAGSGPGTGKPASGGKISIYLEDYSCQTQEESPDKDDQKYTAKGKEWKNCLVIEDNGIGIWPEDLPRVFEKGFTGYNGRTDKKSTGIGLYLCKSVTDKLRHQIWIESEPGRGTKVYLSLGRKTVRHE